MSHTPEQAGELWCPMVRSVRWETDSYDSAEDAPTRALGGCNSGGQSARSPKSARCIADKCAMWRWEHTTASVPAITTGANGMRARTFENRTVRTHGFCGLAGRLDCTA